MAIRKQESLTLFLVIVLLSLHLHGSTPSSQLLGVILPVSRHQDNSFETFKHLGHLSPFFVPPNTPASLRSGTPPGCTVERAFLIRRHGSRRPHEDEFAIIQNLSHYIHDNRDLFSNPLVKLPDAYSFLSEGWNSTFGTDSLTAPGRQQLFDHGVALKLQYLDFDNVTEVLASDSDRVVESARWFMDGYYGRISNYTATVNVVPENETTVSWITPYLACPKWDSSYGEASLAKWRQVYIPPITKRINKLLAEAYPGINFTDTHTSAMLYSCAYETAIRGIGSSPWCDVFLPSEISDNEYEYDLRMRGFAGYGLPGDMAPVLGSLLVSNVTSFLQRDEGPKLSLSFGHDKTIALGLTALGLASDELPPTGPVDPDRAWRAAKLMPFAANMIWQRLDCDGHGRIQLILNGANYGLGPVGCEIDNYGSCALGDFLNTTKVQAALNCTHGDERWKEACH
ncbi:phosphoglycerate mutase-like protein [Daldinia caldariorum]|uniref:phosphoglycerate mutase-like protein n=1 Tax=Daldinia caldariorum TaxID=326644 RepID=UPI002007C3C9|nr:phosphoglycerate mutase-like protein [Daldinia caldariorum]KAI1469076.1 phosphoglycerate mutase-like protein [Daldinia caldariorum]